MLPVVTNYFIKYSMLNDWLCLVADRGACPVPWRGTPTGGTRCSWMRMPWSAGSACCTIWWAASRQRVSVWTLWGYCFTRGSWPGEFFPMIVFFGRPWSMSSRAGHQFMEVLLGYCSLRGDKSCISTVIKSV